MKTKPKKLIKSTKPEPITTPYSYPLFEHMSRQHGLTLTEDELSGIVLAVDRMRAGKKNNPLQVFDENGYGWRAIVDERLRQQKPDGEGFEESYDDMNTWGELEVAARCYENYKVNKKIWNGVPEDWPWDKDWWKPTTRVRDLVKAGALYLAESDRLHRAGEPRDRQIQLAKRCAVKIDTEMRKGK